MADKRIIQCVEMLRQLVADVQGAPYPGGDIQSELYAIWYEHVQRSAIKCFEFLSDNFPEDSKALSKQIDKLIR